MKPSRYPRWFSLLPRRSFLLLSLIIWPLDYSLADEDLWHMKHTLQGYVQIYSTESARSNSIAAGYLLSAEYLDSGSLTFGFDSSFVKFDNSADDSGQFLYLSGIRHLFPDSLPGRLSLRLDSWSGEESVKFRSASSSSVARSAYAARKAISLGSGIVTETTDIDAYYLDASFINYNKTMYADMGYAWSEYDGTESIDVSQMTPTIAFGWNDSYDWLQFRGYLIDIDQQKTSFADDKFGALEAKYTHWYAESSRSNLEFVRLSILSGERMLAVDPDAAVIYSIADVQQSNISGSMQWKLSPNTKLLALVQYDQYEDFNARDYDSFLFYINLQFHQ